jgi:hypothetical protein
MSKVVDYINCGLSPLWAEPYEPHPREDWFLNQVEEEYRQRKGMVIESLGDVLAIRLLSNRDQKSKQV